MNKDMIKVYIASPYSKGNKVKNVKRHMHAYHILTREGFAAYAPLWSHFQHCLFPKDYEEWLKLDLEWLKVCDCVLRLSGESKGADKEVEVAKEMGLPVFNCVVEIENYYKKMDNITQ